METRSFDETTRRSNFSKKSGRISRMNFQTINEVELAPSQKIDSKKSKNTKYVHKVDLTTLQNNGFDDENDDDDDILEINLANESDSRKKIDLPFMSPKNFLNDESCSSIPSQFSAKNEAVNREPIFQNSKRSNRNDIQYSRDNFTHKEYSNNDLDQTSQSFYSLHQIDNFEINTKEHQNKVIKDTNVKKNYEEEEIENDNESSKQKEINIYPETTASHEKPNDFSNLYFEFLVYDTIDFIQTTPSNDLMVRCKVIVDKGMFNQYAFYLEDNFGGYLLLKACRKKTFKQYFYSISTANSDTSYKFGHLSSNYTRGEYALTGNYDDNDKTSEKKYSDVQFTTRMIGSTKPKDLLAELLLFENDERQSLEQQKSDSMSNMFRREVKRSVRLTTKKPYFDPKTKTYRLKFDGRVKMPSSNNLQLIDESKPDTTVFQLGKIKSKVYSCDFTYPFCAFSAFAMAVTCLSRT